MGAKSAFLHHFYTKNDPFIKTGSGQTQGNAEKREARFSAPQGPYSNTYQNEDHTFSFGIWKNVYLLPVAAESAVCIRKPPFKVTLRNDHFTKTGSGQTQEHLRKRPFCCAGDYGCRAGDFLQRAASDREVERWQPRRVYSADTCLPLVTQRTAGQASSCWVVGR